MSEALQEAGSEELAEAQQTAAGLLPFTFARRFGVLVQAEPGADGRTVVACKTQPALSTLAEIKRFVQHPLVVRLVADEEFESLLSSTYARDSSAARQMVEDMGDELDLASLAESVPETEDEFVEVDSEGNVKKGGEARKAAGGKGAAGKGRARKPAARAKTAAAGAAAPAAKAADAPAKDAGADAEEVQTAPAESAEAPSEPAADDAPTASADETAGEDESAKA